MGYSMQNGRWANTLALTPFGAQTLNASTNGNAIELGDRGTVRLTLAVTSATGTNPTLDVSIQTRRDAADTWRPIGAFTTATGASTQRLCLSAVDRFVRAVATIGGSAGPSFTFSVDGEAV